MCTTIALRSPGAAGAAGAACAASILHAVCTPLTFCSLETQVLFVSIRNC